MTAAVDLLFSPIELSGVPLRNRIVHASMTTRMSAQGDVTEPQLRYFANRARGGAAMIVTEPLTLSALQDVAHKTRAWDDAHEPALKRWADAVETHGARLVAAFELGARRAIKCTASGRRTRSWRRAPAASKMRAACEPDFAGQPRVWPNRNRHRPGD